MEQFWEKRTAPPGKVELLRTVGVPDSAEGAITSSPQIDHKHPGLEPQTPA